MTSMVAGILLGGILCFAGLALLVSARWLPLVAWLTLAAIPASGGLLLATRSGRELHPTARGFLLGCCFGFAGIFVLCGGPVLSTRTP